MGAKQNLIIVGLRNQWTIGQLLRILSPFIERTLGTLGIFSVVTPATGALRDEAVVDEPEHYVVELSANELGTFYPVDRQRGSVGVAKEGRFEIVVISLSEHTEPVSLCRSIWQLAGSLACAVLVGEELEVEDVQLEEVLARAELPESLDLCEAAIVRPQQEVRLDRERCEYSGIRLR